MTHESHSSTVFLVDLGYLSFYRYYAARKWLGFQKEFDQINPWQNEEKFRDILINQYTKSLNKYMQEGYCYFAMESLDKKNWRKDIYKEYKANRPKNYDIYTYFQHLVTTFLPEFVKNNPNNCQLLRRPCTEADDLIALIAMDLSSQANPPQIRIITSDMDFLQLVEDDNTIQLLDANLKSKSDNKPLKGQAYLRRKIVYGDPSDNISPLFKGKNSTKLKTQLFETLQEIENLDTVSESDFATKELYEAFLLNRTLIDFRMIPNRQSPMLMN